MKYLGDEFDSPTGRFDKYFAVDENIVDGIYQPGPVAEGTVNDFLQKQKHTDIRSIQPRSSKVLATMLHFTALFDMQSINKRPMDQLGSIYLSSIGEVWNRGAIGVDPARNSWRVLSLDCAANEETILRSVLRR